jgi:hypothetical protein
MWRPVQIAADSVHRLGGGVWQFVRNVTFGLLIPVTEVLMESPLVKEVT